MKKIVIFNGSGMFLNLDKSGFNILASKLGKKKEAEKQEKRYKAGRKKGPWGLEVLASLFKDVKKEKIDLEARKLVNKNLKKEAISVIKELKKQGFAIVCYSSELVSVLQFIQQKLGLDGIYGNILEFKAGRATGKLKENFDRYARANKIEEVVKANKLRKQDVFIVGDSVTAVASAKYGKLIALNAQDKEIIKRTNSQLTDFDELPEVLI